MKENCRGNGTKLCRDCVVGAGSEGGEARIGSDSRAHLLERCPIVQCSGTKEFSANLIEVIAIQEGPI